VPVTAATSRARPTRLRQSARLGVSFSVMSLSSSSRQERISMPTGASAGSTSRPSTLSSRPISLAPHSMPDDSTPRTLACLISICGSFAPTRAQGTFWPTATLGAPHTICSGSASPTFTLHTRRRSASGCGSTASTSATTTPAKGGAAGSTASTSRPAMVRRWASSSVDSCGLTSVRSQDSGNCMFNPKLNKEDKRTGERLLSLYSCTHVLFVNRFKRFAT